MWLRFKFKAAARRKTRSGMGPDLDVRSIPSDRVGPLQGVRVAPCRAVLTTRARNREPAADAKADDTDLARIDRKSVVEGKSGDSGGRRLIQKNQSGP